MYDACMQACRQVCMYVSELCCWAICMLCMYLQPSFQRSHSISPTIHPPPSALSQTPRPSDPQSQRPRTRARQGGETRTSEGSVSQPAALPRKSGANGKAGQVHRHVISGWMRKAPIRLMRCWVRSKVLVACAWVAKSFTPD